MSFDLPSDSREELQNLVDLMLHQKLNSQQTQLLNDLLEDDSAMKFYLHYLDFQANLSWLCRGEEFQAASEKVVQPAHCSKSIPHASNPDSRSSGRTLQFAIALSVLLLAIAGVCIFKWTVSHQNSFVQDVDDLKNDWGITPTGNAQYELVDSHVIRLDRGEILVENTSPPNRSSSLTIKTPFGDAIAYSGSAYVGTHFPPENDLTFKPLTRVLSLSGHFTLNNSLGESEGGSNAVLIAESGSPPEQIVSQVNNDFSIRLFKHLSRQSQPGRDGNLFFSPYAIANAIAMLSEGARGDTATEIGEVLGLPPQLRRLGDDEQLVPWRFTLIHSGLSEISQRLTEKGNDPDEQAAIDRLENMKDELAEIEAKIDSPNGWNARDYNRASRLVDDINELSKQISNHELRIANGLWVDQLFPISESYLRTINEFYHTGDANRVDFRNDLQAASAKIRSWCEDKTNGKISFDIGELPFDDQANLQLLIANAIYFNAEWMVPFHEENTKVKPFTLIDGNEVESNMMYAPAHESARYGAINLDGSSFITPAQKTRGQIEGLYPENGFLILELPYRGDDISMVVVIPTGDNPISNLNTVLTNFNLSTWLSGLEARKVHVSMPRFKLETDYSLNQPLQALGLRKAFEMPGPDGGADFSGLTNSTSPKHRIFVGSFLHRSVIDVNEKGTEAAALNVVAAKDGKRPIHELVPFTPSFNANRPFAFFIKENESDTILFMGTMVHPDQITESKTPENSIDN